MEWVAGKHVLYVHEQEFLVLLLMVEPEGDEFGHAGLELAVQKLFHGLVDEFAVAGDFGDAGAGDMPALGAGMSITERLVVRS